ncbi:IS1595 family transposase [Nisaea sp.]|uniref:IS1595 family transposase n=1 Tax=Nisaea sp. TaxID=2024842 RepID=UPI003B529483
MDITAKIYHDEDAAREHLEQIRWPNGAICPDCNRTETVSALGGKSMGPGWYHCNACRKKFTVRVGTIYERSKIGLHKWVLATHLFASSKKGISAHQLHRMLGVTYKTAWFMAHRIRESMREFSADPVGGDNKVVEADETYIGGKAKNRAFRKPRAKEAVMSLVERDGKVRSRHIPDVTGRTVRKTINEQVDIKSMLMTDEAPVYRKPGKAFSAHGTVNHSIEEYVRGGFFHTNTVENYFSILKRGIHGTYQAVSKKHLKRYLGEFDFRYNHRNVDDFERAVAIIKGAEGKRLTYRRTAAWA